MTNEFSHIWHTKDGFERLFKAKYNPLCAFASGIIKDSDAAEEIVQEVFVKLWAQRDKIDVSASISSYLYSAVRNAALNAIKHLQVKEAYKKQNKIERDNAENVISDALIGSELEQKINVAISRLPSERKKIFLLSRTEGLKYKEIAEKLEISVKTVENQMGKALASLRNELAEFIPAVLIAIILGMK